MLNSKNRKMRLSIENLKVNSYSNQVPEKELTEVKGGTTPVCAVVVAALLLASCEEEKQCTETKVTTCSDGTQETTTKKVDCDDY